MVRSCKNWEKDNKGNGTNLELFRYLFPSKSAMYNQWVPQPNGVSDLSSEQCLLHVGNLIEPYPILRIRCSVQVMASRWLRSDGGTKMGRERTCRFLRHGGRDYVAQLAPSARSGSGMYSQQLEQNQYASLICTKPKHPPAPIRNEDTIPHYRSSLLSPATVECASFFFDSWTVALHYTARSCSSNPGY